jgi:hypothetical protein
LQVLQKYLPKHQGNEVSLPPPLPGYLPQVFFDQGDKIHALEDEVLLYQEIFKQAALVDTKSSESENQSQKNKILILQEEALHLKKINQRLEAEKEQLKGSIKELSKKEIDLGVTVDSQKQDQKDYECELKDTKSKLVSMQMRLEEIKNCESEALEAIELSKLIKQKLKQAEAKQQHDGQVVRRVQQENTLIKEKYQKLHAAYKKIKLELKSSQAGSALNDTITNFSLDSVSDAINLSLDVDAKKLEQERSLKQIKEVQGNLDEKDSISEEEVLRLTGNLFEIDNAAHWYIKDNDQELGPFSFEQMIEMKDRGKISQKCMIRHAKETWKPMSNVYEFCAPYKFSIIQEENQLTKRFYLEREAVRVPFYELVNLDLDGGSIKGYCTSLSVGGCFIELSRNDMKKVSKDAIVQIELKSDALCESLMMSAKIVNISEARPRGIGMMFLEVSEETKDVIQTYVNRCLDIADSKKKAA